MAYSALYLENLIELKSRRGNSTDTTIAAILGLNYPTEEAFSIYVWNNTSTATADDDEVVQPTVGGILTGRWYKINLSIKKILIISALGYTPYDETNPFGYITSTSSNMLTNKSGNISQWINDSGYLTNFTETDPTVATYSKGLTAFSSIKYNTDLLYEPIFSKNNAFNKNFGTTSLTITEGNDIRVIEGATAFSWGNHATFNYITATSTNTLTNKSGNISQWTNDSGYLLSFTETDPTVATYSKGLTGFSVIKNSTDLLYEPLFSKNNAFNKNFGTTSLTVAEGNDVRIINGATAFSWGNHVTAGYLTTSLAAVTYQPIGNYLTPSSVHTLTNKSGNISQWTNDSGYLLSFTESDPTVPTYSKSLTNFIIIKNSTDLLYSLLGHTHSFSSLISIPTTIGGYGITDFNSLGDARWSLLSHTHSFSSLISIPTTIGGYGITDFNSLGDARWSLLSHTHSFASLISKPTTISGYGITDFNSLGDARWSLLGHTHSFASLISKPTTLAGYGITDAYPLVGNPSNFITLTSLSAGTGITYSNTTGLITNSLPDQVVTLTAGNRITVTGSYPNFTIAFVEPTINIITTKTLNTGFTVSTTKQATVSYTLTCSVTNPLVAGNSTATVFLEYSTNGGSTWNLPSQNGNVSAVGLAVAVSITNTQTVCVFGIIPANAMVRLRTTTSGTATVTYVTGTEVY